MRESLWNMKTLENIRTSANVRRLADVHSLCTLSGIEANTPVELDERALAMVLAKDRKRMDNQVKSVQRSQRRLLAMRGKLKAAKVRNQRLQAQRCAIIAARQQQPVGQQPAAASPGPAVAAAAAPPAGRKAPNATALVLKY